LILLLREEDNGRLGKVIFTIYKKKMVQMTFLRRIIMRHKITISISKKHLHNNVDFEEKLEDLVISKNEANEIYADRKSIILLKPNKNEINILLHTDVIGGERITINTIRVFTNKVSIFLRSEYTESCISNIFKITKMQCIDAVECIKLIAETRRYFTDFNDEHSICNFLSKLEIIELYRDYVNISLDYDYKTDLANIEPYRNHYCYQTESLERVIEKIKGLVGCNNYKGEIQRLLKYVKRYKDLWSEPLEFREVLPFSYVVNADRGVVATTCFSLMTEFFFHLEVTKHRRLIEIDGNCITTDSFNEKLKNYLDVEKQSVVLIKSIDSVIDSFELIEAKEEFINKILIAIHNNTDKSMFIIISNSEETLSHIVSEGEKYTNFRRIIFEGFTDNEVINIAKKLFNKKNFILKHKAEANLIECITNLMEDKDLGILAAIKRSVECTIFRKVFNNECKKNSKGMIDIDINDIEVKNNVLNPDEIKLDAFNELNSLKGVTEVKTKVIQIINFLEIQRIRTHKGYSNTPICMHMSFTGNPGTGKTMIARLIGKIFKEIGLLEKGNVYEVGREDLVGVESRRPPYICIVATLNAPEDLVTSLTVGGSLLLATSLVNASGLSGYQALKTAIQDTKSLKNKTADIRVSVSDNGNSLINVSAIAKLALDSNAMSSKVTVTAGTNSQTFDCFSNDGKNIMKNSNSDQYLVSENKTQGVKKFKATANPMVEKSMGIVMDALVGNMKENVTTTENADGTKTIAVNLNEDQVTPLFDALTQMAFVGASNFEGTNHNTGEKTSFNIKNIIPQLKSDIKIEGVTSIGNVNKDDIITKDTAKIMVVGKDAKGVQHEIALNVDLDLSNINSTTPDNVDLTGKQIKTITFNMNKFRR
jgi:hypothetical protein